MESLTTSYQFPTTKPPLVVIVGPTASGKSALGMEIAKRFSGEIISADSRTVYRHLDVGTAKPSNKERQEVRHFGLDVVEPDEPFTAADFKILANDAIHDISSRGKLPIMVGGSGLYIDVVLFDYGFSDKKAPRNKTNPRHLAEGVERVSKPLRESTIIIGLEVSREVLKKRIAGRVDDMISMGLVDEVNNAYKQFPDSKALLAPGYKAFHDYLKGSVSLEEAKERFVSNDFKLAKRQMTWFRRNKSIHWVNNSEEAIKLVTHFLNKMYKA